MLLDVGLNELWNKGFERVKVAVGAANTGANRFYERCGFRLAATRQHHGEPMNIYTIDLSDGMSAAGTRPPTKRPSELPRPSCLSRVVPMPIISQ